jgi:5,10-methylene-tetrahydrofolate dehydrogenase/methenyl tetrahydrofolate cyclohydrolase
MTAHIIDGNAIAQAILDEVAAEVAALKARGVTPGLATVLVGDDPASQTYVRMKGRRCAKVGIHSVAPTLPGDATQAQVEALVRELNADPAIHGILMQLPLPKHLNEEAILNTISLEKDVDGFHPVNIGRLAMKGREPLFAPCPRRRDRTAGSQRY